MAYSEEQKNKLFDEIISFISNDCMALRNVLKKDAMPSSQTFYKWLDEDEDKSKQYARATKVRADSLFDEILDIADAFENDVVLDKEGNPITNHNIIQRDRLRVDARKWALSKLNPKKYGDKLDVTSDGDKINPPTINFTKRE